MTSFIGMMEGFHTRSKGNYVDICIIFRKREQDEAMITIIILGFICLCIPLFIMRIFSSRVCILVALIIMAYMAIVLTKHFLLVQSTGMPIVYDVHTDTAKYYHQTEPFRDISMFSVSPWSIREYTGGSLHFGYQYILAIFWTITEYPILAMRIFKIAVYFIGLCVLARVWKNAYGDKLAIQGFLFLSICFTPSIDLLFRNFKDMIILGIFMMIQAVLDKLFNYGENITEQLSLQSQRHSSSLNIWLWGLLLFLLTFMSTLRFYLAVIIFAAILGHYFLKAGKMGAIKAFTVLFILCGIGVVLLQVSGIMHYFTSMEGYDHSTRAGLGIRTFLQVFLSPLPWGDIWIFDPVGGIFYILYWILLPYAMYCMLRRLKYNLTWHLLVFVMLLWILAMSIGDPPRKRLVVYPIMVMWVLKHQYYKKLSLGSIQVEG